MQGGPAKASAPAPVSMASSRANPTLDLTSESKAGSREEEEDEEDEDSARAKACSVRPPSRRVWQKKYLLHVLVHISLLLLIYPDLSFYRYGQHSVDRRRRGDEEPPVEVAHATPALEVEGLLVLLVVNAGNKQ